MKITKHADKTVAADACFTHYGHSKNISYTWISQKKKRNEIAAKLQQGVSKEKILDDIRITLGLNIFVII